MRVGLDLDGLLGERPDFFAFLAAALRPQGPFVAVLTCRDPASRPKTEAQLAGWGVAYDEPHFARSLRDKGRLCRELAIDGYFDDPDECLRDVGEGTTAFKIGDGGNFDSAAKQWLSTEEPTRLR